MVFTSIVLSLVIALIFAFILAYPFKREGPGPMRGLVVFFFIIFLFTLAIGSLVDPIGPTYNGQAWLSYVIPGFFILLLIATLIPVTKEKPGVQHEDAVDEYEKEKITRFVLGFFFWLLVVSLLAVYLLRVTEVI
jgi:hypothetical protein